MSRRALVDATYDAAERLNALKLETGRIGRRRAASVSARILAARALRARLDQGRSGHLDAAAQAALRGDVVRFSTSTVCDKQELAWRGSLFNFRFSAILRATAHALAGLPSRK